MTEKNESEDISNMNNLFFIHGLPIDQEKRVRVEKMSGGEGIGNMNNLLFLPITLMLGVLLGNIYFRGLWMTVQQLPTTENPILLTFGSFLGRLAIAIAGFVLVVMVTKEHAIWHLFVCVGAFMGVRNYLVRKVQPTVPSTVPSTVQAIVPSKFNPI
jgi:F1F0 ATPase subunit 2